MLRSNDVGCKPVARRCWFTMAMALIVGWRNGAVPMQCAYWSRSAFSLARVSESMRSATVRLIDTLGDSSICTSW